MHYKCTRGTNVTFCFVHTSIAAMIVLRLVSLQVNDLELKQVTDAGEAPVVIHGTSKKAWRTIQAEVYLFGILLISHIQITELS